MKRIDMSQIDLKMEFLKKNQSIYNGLRNLIAVN